MILVRAVAALASLTVTISVSAASWDDDSHYVSLGPRNGYYIVQPDSHLIRQLGLYEAPWIDTADPCGTAMAQMRSRFGSIGTAY